MSIGWVMANQGWACLDGSPDYNWIYSYLRAKLCLSSLSFPSGPQPVQVCFALNNGEKCKKASRHIIALLTIRLETGIMTFPFYSNGPSKSNGQIPIQGAGKYILPL